MSYQVKYQTSLRQRASTAPPQFVEAWAFNSGERFFAAVQSATKSIYRIDLDLLGSTHMTLRFQPKAIGYWNSRDALCIGDAGGNLYKGILKGGTASCRLYSPREDPISPRGEIWGIKAREQPSGALYALAWLSGPPAPDAGGGYYLLTETTKDEEKWLPLDIDNMDIAPTAIAIDPVRPTLYMAMGRAGTVSIWDISTEVPKPSGVLSLNIRGRLTNRPLSRARINPKDGSLWLASYNALLRVPSVPQAGQLEAPTDVKEVTFESDVINDFNFSADGERVIAACTYSDRIAIADATYLDKPPEYIEVANPGKVEVIDDRVYVLGHTSEQLYLIE